MKAESSKKSFRTIDEIQEDFRKLKIDLKTDLEILTSMMQSYKSSDISDRDRVVLLKELEYYVHQVCKKIPFEWHINETEALDIAFNNSL